MPQYKLLSVESLCNAAVGERQGVNSKVAKLFLNWSKKN